MESELAPPPTPTESRCQWCGAVIPAGETTCPACGARAVSQEATAAFVAQQSVASTATDRDPLAADLDLAALGLAEPEPLPFATDPPDPTAGPIRTAGIVGGCAVVGAVFGFAVLGPLLGGILINTLALEGAEPGSFSGLGVFAGILIGLAGGAAAASLTRR